MRKSLRTTLAFLLLLSAFGIGCGEDGERPEVTIPTGLRIQDFPITPAAVWVYQEVDAPENQYRISVEGTRMISAEITWKLVYTQLDPSGNPIIGEPPPPSDFYSANGLHLRLTALTRTPGIFARAVFIGGKKAAAAEPFPVAAVYVRKTLGRTFDRLEEDDPNPREPIRYDEFDENTEGIYLEVASEGRVGDREHFQKHLPPRRFWQFPMKVGSRWVVFRTNEIARGTGRDPQPAILAERRVAAEENVSTPAYTGPALLVEEWVTGLEKDENGDLIIPSLDDEDGDGVPERGEPTARYWVAKGIGVVQYEYEFVDLGPPAAFTRKTYVLTRYSFPDRALGGVKTE